jgi:hypothetical protein
VSAFVAAGAGFLLAVLWFDLMFDVQVLGHDGEIPEDALESIASYYRRVTTAARPMSRLIAAVIVLTLAAIAVELGSGDQDSWVAWLSLALAILPIALAGGRIVPRAVRLGARIDPPARQRVLARSIFREHVLCALAISALMAVQLAFA